MALTIFTGEGQFVVEHCCNSGCGIAFGITRERYNRLKDDGGSFYCTNGHSQHYTTTTVAALERKLSVMENSRDFERREKEQRERTVGRVRREKSALKGLHTKKMNRIKNGTCPHCNRYFKNMHRHMESKHQEKKK